MSQNAPVGRRMKNNNETLTWLIGQFGGKHVKVSILCVCGSMNLESIVGVCRTFRMLKKGGFAIVFYTGREYLFHPEHSDVDGCVSGVMVTCNTQRNQLTLEIDRKRYARLPVSID